MPRPVSVREVLPRDGFQDERALIPTATKLAIVERLWQAGLRWIEVSSMVHPRKLPQFADAQELLAQLAERDLDGLVRSVFVPNRRGLERALAAGAQEVSLAVASTDTLSRENFGMDRDAALAEVLAVVAQAHAAGVRSSVTIGGAFGCPFEGAVAPETVSALASQLAQSAAESLFVADTIGVAKDGEVAALVGRLAFELPVIPLGIHLHGGPGAVGDVLAAIDAGATLVDASTSGLGACPFVPHAPGNVPTELVVAALHRAGVATDLDAAALSAAARDITHVLKEVRSRELTDARR
ncbi:hydroxymethylglutaryl-CoA lyase [Conexibacter sp. CPCC 206217]|uniref:hydroxymethylglutaryl-CoA lyase n=1 Tax=Conexibacter sp. CPCC 206217 TaxID=3064574 RepID=UPI002718CB25|nr:hydroxymethylglutaryl-CoA lyase [Conexibacter sp. CPCC 206217]MDO8211110.1 hydroxymethylglutaryl-CoA lyase [Conexibacter sp. CPCC 206217]